MIRTTDVVEIHPEEVQNGMMAVYLRTRQGEEYCIAVESWHPDIDGLISYPAIHDHYEEWLMRCGYNAMNGQLSAELEEKLRTMLIDNEVDILKHLRREKCDKAFWANLYSKN